MERQIKGLNSIKTIKKLNQGGIGRVQTNPQLELYLLENNRTLIDREMESVLKRKAHLEGRLQEIQGRLEELGVEGKKEKKGGIRRATAVGSTARGSFHVMKIEY